MNPLVSICCLTYNHVAYIRQCLDGFLLQQCDFEFEILIHDDASTDGTQEIIKDYQQKYPEIIKPILQTENQWSKGVRGISFKHNFPRASGKYIALCEGDDYWTDLLKLKRQVEFLEGHPTFSLTCGGYRKRVVETGEEEVCIIEKNGQSGQVTNSKGYEFSLAELSDKWVTKTLTVVFRKEFLDVTILNEFQYSRDVHLYHQLLTKGNGFYFTEVFGVYHIHPGGIHSLKSKEVKIENAYLVFKELYEAKKDVYTKSQIFKALLNKLRFETEYRSSLRTFAKRLRLAVNSIKKAQSVKDIIRVCVVLFSIKRT